MFSLDRQFGWVRLGNGVFCNVPSPVRTRQVNYTCSKQRAGVLKSRGTGATFRDPGSLLSSEVLFTPVSLGLRVFRGQPHVIAVELSRPRRVKIVSPSRDLGSGGNAKLAKYPTIVQVTIPTAAYIKK